MLLYLLMVFADGLPDGKNGDVTILTHLDWQQSLLCWFLSRALSLSCCISAAVTWNGFLVPVLYSQQVQMRELLC